MFRFVGQIFCVTVIAICLICCLQKPAVSKTKVALVIEPIRTNVHFSTYTQNTIQQYWDYMQNTWGYSGATLVFRNDSFYTWCGGEADSGVNLTLDMPLQIASLSKTFCATACMQLIVKGKLSLQDSIRKFFPELPYNNISIENLLSHGSGLPEYVHFVDHIWKDSMGRLTNEKVLDLLISEKPPLYYQPGKRHFYCNTNFVLLALVIEKISGLSYPEYLRKNIFQPLGMSKTRVLLPQNSISNMEVKGHNINGTVYPDDYQDGTYGDKNIVSTVWDLYRFFRALKTNQLFPQKHREEMFRTRWFHARGQSDYALGWRKRISGSENWLFHTGWWHGFRANMYICFEQDEFVVTLANRLSGGFIPAYYLTNFTHPRILDSLTRAHNINNNKEY
jgi:CubicO group peptidase (beta-lactamase class C family)